MMSNIINNPQVKIQYNNTKVEHKILFQNVRFFNSLV